MTKAESRQQWSAPTSDGEAYARARGRRRYAAVQRDRALARRALVHKRLSELRKEAWAKGSLDWIPKGAVAQIAVELGYAHQTISMDIKVIEREELRHMALAPRLPVLREEAGVGYRGRLPKSVIHRLAYEYGVRPWTVRRDIAAIDRHSPPTPPAPMRGVWDCWAHLRPRPTKFPAWLRARVTQDTYDWFMARENPSEAIRLALEEYRGGTQGYHTLEQCAFRVAQACHWDVHGRLVRTAMRLSRPLVEVLSSLIRGGLQKEEA
jgi:hypothetical protein